MHYILNALQEDLKTGVLNLQGFKIFNIIK